MPFGFGALVLDQRLGTLARLEIGAKDLAACSSQLLPDQRLDGFGVVAAALLVVCRIGHHRSDTATAASETGAVRLTAGDPRSRGQSFAVTASSTDAKRSRAAARRAGTCSVGRSSAGGA